MTGGGSGGADFGSARAMRVGLGCALGCVAIVGGDSGFTGGGGSFGLTGGALCGLPESHGPRLRPSLPIMLPFTHVAPYVLAVPPRGWMGGWTGGWTGGCTTGLVSTIGLLVTTGPGVDGAGGWIGDATPGIGGAGS
jgi:hypothetical protein